MAGSRLRSLLASKPKMLSSTLMALMAKKSASSLMTNAPDSAEDKGDEQSSILSPHLLKWN